MTAIDRLRAVFEREPTFYERAWLTSINLVGVIIVGAVLFDIAVLLGEGTAGIFQRALYPLVPLATTLGVAISGSNGRNVAISGGLLAGYVFLLALVGTLGAALSSGRAFVFGGLTGVVALVALGWLLDRYRHRFGPTTRT